MARRKITVMPDFIGAWCWEGREDDSRLGPCSDVEDEISADLHREFVAWQRIFEGAPMVGEVIPAWAEGWTGTEPAEFIDRLFDDPDYRAPVMGVIWEKFHAQGLALTKRLAAELGEGVAVFYEAPSEDHASTWSGRTFSVSPDGSVQSSVSVRPGHLAD